MKRFLSGMTLAAVGRAPSTQAAENLLGVPAQNANKSGVAPPLDETGLPMVDRIVAVVNNSVITYSELTDRTNLIATQLTRQGVTLPERHILMRQVLEKMVMDNVQMQYAKDAGIKVDDTQLDQSIVRIAEQNKLPLAAFRSAVEKEGVTWSKFREEIREEIILAHLREREVENRVVVSDSEIDAQIAEENERGASAQDEFQLAHILISVPENASPERVAQRQKKIQEALDQLNKGMEFAEVAASFSEAPDALKGGDLGWRPAARLPSLFANAASKLKPGEYSGILRSPNGFHILKLVSRRGSEAPAPITQFHVRQILVKVNPDADPNEAINKISSVNARLLGGEDFGKLATLSSEDESRNRAGDLGWISEGETLPQFEKIIKSLKPGETSSPFQTPLGWHIIQLLEVRQADATLERRRLAARQGLRARKSDEAYDEWVRQLRDQAYVDIRLDER